MSFSLYDATVPSYLQIIGAVQGFLAKAEAHCADGKAQIADIAGGRLAPDMLPLGFQIASVAAHSAGAIEAVGAGEMGPPRGAPPETLAQMKDILSGAEAKLKALTPGDVNALIGKPMQFKLPGFTLNFTGENFLMSFSLPNFYFHASTAYGILRNQGVPLGKRDFLGQLRINP
jgi:uncharacterized protein